MPSRVWFLALAVAVACDRPAVSSGLECTLTIPEDDSIPPGDIVVADPPLCPPDVIQLEHLVTLGGDEPGALSNPPHQVHQDSRGRFYLLGSFGGMEVPVVYQSNGQFLTALGRIGDGPGEYRMPAALLVGPGDTVYVLDFISRRLTVLSPDYAAIRSVNFVHRPEMGGKVAVLLENGQLATNLDTRGADRERSGSALQVLDRDGRIAHEFDEAPSTPEAGVGGFRRMRTLGPSGHGFWSGTLLFRYRLELWDSTGRRLARLERRPPWFLPYDTLLSRTPENPPYSHLASVREDTMGRLWAVSFVADSQWAEGLSSQPVEGEGGIRFYRTEYPEKTLDTMIEVIDPVTGRLLVSRRFDGLYPHLISDSLIGRTVYDESGIPAVEIYRVSLTHQGT
jgi:hypothetical protein